MSAAPQVLVVNAGSSSLKYQLIDAGRWAHPRHGAGVRDRRGQPAPARGGRSPARGCPGVPGPRCGLRRGPGRPRGERDRGRRRVPGGGGPPGGARRPPVHRTRPGRRRGGLGAADPRAARAAAQPRQRRGDRARAGRVPGHPTRRRVRHRRSTARCRRTRTRTRCRGPGATSTRVRRYGFHGSSYAWVARRTAVRLGRDAEEVRMVVLHLGNGASACAVDGGRSVETSMGLSPAEGLVMGTRSGDVDPALAGYLARVAGLSAEEYDRSLNRESGLLGLGRRLRLPDLEERRSAGDAGAALAFDVTVHRLRKYVGAYAAVLGRLDALAFTGGIGERSRGAAGRGGRRAGGAGSAARRRGERAGSGRSGGCRRADSAGEVWVVPTDEEREIGRPRSGWSACRTRSERWCSARRRR